MIGTHRLLSRDVEFARLGLIVVDEEHRFGVRHKERLKQLKLETDVLTLTATPIPRSLHLALAGLRDMTLMQTAPRDRSPVLTFVEPWDDGLIEEGIARMVAWPRSRRCGQPCALASCRLRRNELSIFKKSPKRKKAGLMAGSLCSNLRSSTLLTMTPPCLRGNLLSKLR